MISLGKRIRKNYIVISLIAIIIIIVLSNIGIKYYFTNYISAQNKIDDEEILTYINNGIEGDGIFDNRELSYLKQQSHFKDVEIIILDNEKDVVFVSSRGMGMGKGMGMGSMNHNPFKEDYIYSENELIHENELLGYILIGHYKNIITSKADNDFLFAINILYIVSFCITVFVATLLSVLLEKRITKPIIEIKNSTRNISRGNYKLVENINADTVELDELATSIKELARQLDEQEQLRKRLSNDISHELRSPLAVLRGQIEAIIDGVLEPTGERLAKIYDEIIRMTKLINDLNELAVVESQELKLCKVNVNLKELLTSVIEGFLPLMNSKNIVIEKKLDDNIYYMGDRDRLKQIFVNLLNNAYKYTNEGGKIEVVLYKSIEGITISFVDTGIGIKEEDYPYIFQRFYRSDDSRSRKTGGAGIGLSIVKELVKAHNGLITVESEVGIGSNFTIIFK
ncbi:MAG: ATP-binding protein [Vallitalea sp.]|jgi:signal transduction histidine kinase|nr:ATP-binding protein [Vallitalea sp.]